MEITVITNDKERFFKYLKLIVRYRALIVSFCYNDLRNRYSQTKLGFFWLLLFPLFALTVFTILFQEFINLNTENVPYPLFAYSGMVLWFYFTSTLTQCSMCLKESQDLIKRTYFPKIILPLSKWLLCTFEAFLSLLILFAMALVMGYDLGLHWLFTILPVMTIGVFGFTIGAAVSILSLKKRDLLQFVPYASNFAIWLTPVFYPLSIVPDKYLEWCYWLNPVTIGIELFRSSIFSLDFNYGYLMIIPIILVLFLFVINLFKKRESLIADYI